MGTATQTTEQTSTRSSIEPVCDARGHYYSPHGEDIRYFEEPCTEPAKWLVHLHYVGTCEDQIRVMCDRHLNAPYHQYNCTYCGSKRVLGVTPL